MRNVAREFIQKRPNTSLFISLLLLSSCIPVAIFLPIVLGFFFVMLIGLLIIQGTIIGFGLTTLMVILPGPLCFATFCTLLAYIAQCVFAKMKPVCKSTLEDFINRVQVIFARFPISQSKNLSEIMAFMTRGNGQEDSLTCPVDKHKTSSLLSRNCTPVEIFLAIALEFYFLMLAVRGTIVCLDLTTLVILLVPLFFAAFSIHVVYIAQ